ncbi:ureidoacrylate peracid hydrolase [Kaistia soli DSM 19436]|uniref:Ureidoacrylate peracid hydrolase n=1 Tax=Kaistia soli DSM 19436 TaxID=1122133 RepID=A0A1M4U1S0_9HYPH|nr:cysteine hydrolase [Kaistia soli]SHE50557.1 ureidoacrylate peracid hydrolase [Kaistia soli DSM 19436]
MHKVSIPDHIAARGRLQRGGKEFIFDQLDMSKVAHVIVDLQNGFVAEGAPVEVPVAREIVGSVNAIAKAVRAAGGINCFLRYTYDGKEKLPWNVWFQNYMSPTQFDIMTAAFARGADDWQLWPELDVQVGDLVVDKTRFSALIPDTCDMDQMLKARGIDTLIITGTLTNCCCESTARDALQMGYNVIFVTDGNATLSDEEHNATLLSMSAIFADVMDTNRLLGLIEASASARAAA